MKSTVLALLPLAGLALAESVCQPKTVTKTVYAYEPESTSEAQVVKDEATPKPSAPTPTPSTCSRRTVTTTTVEKVTVTITAADDVTTTKYSTSTRTRTTTVTVRPSKAPMASSPAAVPNPSPTPAATPAASATSSLPDFMLVGSSKPAASYAEQQPSAAAAPAPSSTMASQQPAASPSSGTSAAGSKSGDATFYGGNVAGGMCSFTGYTIPSNLFGTALSDSNWAGAQACGQCVKVTGPDGNQITAMVVDQCPGCGPNHLDLFPDAFAKLAQPSKGVIKVSWDFVPCGITSPIVLKNKSGTSKFWFSMQVMNSNVGVSKLEVSTDGGSSWKATTRQPYNFFENSSGFGTDSVDVKITSIDGKTIVVKDVSIADSTTKTTGENF